MTDKLGAPRSSLRNNIIIAFVLLTIIGGISFISIFQHVIQTSMLQEGIDNMIVDRVVRNFTFISTGLTMTAFIVVLFVAMFISTTITKPIKKLADGVADISMGRLDTEIDVSSQDEFGQLAEAFNRMTEDLQKTTVSRDLLIKEMAERKRAEEVLGESEERYKQLIDNIDMGITLIDKDYNIVMANRYQAEMFDKPSLQLIGASCFKEFEKSGEVCPYCPGTRAMVSGRPEVVDTEVVRDDGSKFSAHIRAFPIFGSGGQITGFIEVVEDTTDRKNMEAELTKAQKLDSVGLLAGGIAHDFNNILTGIVGNISVAKANLGTDKAYERLTAAENATAHAASLAKQLLTFSKGGDPVKETTYIRNLIKDSISFSLRGSNVKRDYFIQEDLWAVDIDVGQINQVISNLAINARHAMPEGGLLKVGAENITTGTDVEDTIMGLPKKGQYIKISIEDNGTGIDKLHLDRIFDPYFTTKGGGSGLGLATSYSIINKHDGHITVESQLGAGTTFRFYLPASKELPRDTSSEEIIMSLKGKLHKGIKVLVMDDEEIIRDVTGEMLTSLGYKVDFAVDGNEAIELYRKAKESGEPFGVVIMDLTIPGGMGGKEAIKKLFEIDLGAKVIVSSGYSNDPMMSDYKNYGFRGGIAKPYKLAELSVTVHKVIAGEK